MSPSQMMPELTSQSQWIEGLRYHGNCASVREPVQFTVPALSGEYEDRRCRGTGVREELLQERGPGHVR